MRWRIVAFPGARPGRHGVAALRERGGGGGRRGRVWRRRRRGHLRAGRTLAAADVPIVQWKHSGNHVRPNSAARHQRFVSWLVETYGIERLRSGAGVLDVAGGAGGTSFELAFRRGVPCTVVDPRPIKATASRAARCAAARRCLPRRAAATGSATATARRRSEEEEGEEQEAGAAADAPPPPLAPAGEEAPVAPALARAAEEAGLAAVPRACRVSCSSSSMRTLSRATRGCGATAPS